MIQQIILFEFKKYSDFSRVFFTVPTLLHISDLQLLWLNNILFSQFSRFTFKNHFPSMSDFLLCPEKKIF